jgi:bacteriocin biosynthesis cyclodehydratase domain-containing protein
MNHLDTRRPRLALPYTILTEPDTVRLVAGEDFRYTLTGPGLERWLPDLLARLDGRPVGEALQPLAEADRRTARQLVERLYGERILADAPAAAAHAAAAYRLAPEGTGPLLASLAAGSGDDGRAAEPLPVLCQDRLDYEEALRFNRRGLAGRVPWLWATSGPMSRGCVSPAFLPDAGPCLTCLLRHFRRLSPAPELYDALREHARHDRPIEPVPFPAPALRVLEAVVRWKAAQLAAPAPAAALYRLHVVEVETLEVTSHRVFADPECPDCGERR